jgi:hypothetical protein
MNNNEIQTRIGTLSFTHDFATGYPTPETVEKHDFVTGYPTQKPSRSSMTSERHRHHGPIVDGGPREGC